MALFARTRRGRNARLVTISSLALVLPLLLSCSLAPCRWASVDAAAQATGSGAGGGVSLPRLILLRNNSFGARCLDGSPPGYYFRPGAGAGVRRWVVHMRGGGWCSTPVACAWRSKTRLGSSRRWLRSKDPRILPTLGGILSGNREENPGFAGWSLAVLNYCDGGGFAGRKGRTVVADVPETWVNGWMGGGAGGTGGPTKSGFLFPSIGESNGRGSSSSGGGGGGGSGLKERGLLSYRQVNRSSRTDDSSSSSGASRFSREHLWEGGGQEVGDSEGRRLGGRVGEDGSGMTSVQVYLEGHRVVSAFMADLVGSRGMGRATHVLVSGCSAGAQAVMAVCDRFKRLLPRTTVKCLMDGGMFIDARGRRGRRPMRSRVRRTVALHAMQLNSNCMSDFQRRRQWRCFFPQHALSRMAAPVFLVNSLFDQIALSLGGQLDSLNRTHTSECIWGIVKARRDIQHMMLAGKGVRRRFWAQGAADVCGENEEGAVVSAAFDTFKYIRAVTGEREGFGAFLLARRPWHCSTTTFLWSLAAVNGVKLNTAVFNWIMDKGKTHFYF